MEGTLYQDIRDALDLFQIEKWFLRYHYIKIIQSFRDEINYLTTISKMVIDLITKQSVLRYLLFGYYFSAYGVSMTGNVKSMGFDVSPYMLSNVSRHLV